MLEKLFEIAKPHRAEDLAKLELAAARRSLLEAQSALEYAESMVMYNKKRVTRLEAYLVEKQ